MVQHDETRIYVGLLMLTIGIFGSMVNVHNVIFMYYCRDYSSSYGYLCIARGICNILNLFLFVFYTAPTTIFNLFPPEDNVGRIAELVVGIPYAAIPVIQLGAAYNRVIAIYLPFSYDKLCNKRLALMTIGLGLCYGTFITLHEIFAKCRFVYNPNILSWNYLDCKRQVLELKFIYPVVIMAAMTILMNLFTATRVLVERIRKKSTSQQKKKNIKLFWQGFIQEMFFANDLLWQDFLSNLMGTRLWWFVSSTLMWELAHTCDGLAFLIFDERMRNSLWNVCTRRLYRKSQHFTAKNTTFVETTRNRSQ